MSQTTATRSKRSRRTWVQVVGCSLLLVGFVGWWLGWFAGEPTCHGKTVTQWLDSMALFDEARNAELTDQNTFRYQCSPEVVTNDHALRALIELGPKSLAILEKTLAEPPQWSRTIGPIRRLRMWAEWKWYRLRNPGSTAPRPAPNSYGSFQMMTGDADTSVRIAATWALATEDRGDSDVLQLLEATLKDKANPATAPRLRRIGAWAAGGHSDEFTALTAGSVKRHQ